VALFPVFSIQLSMVLTHHMVYSEYVTQPLKSWYVQSHPKYEAASSQTSKMTTEVVRIVEKLMD